MTPLLRAGFFVLQLIDGLDGTRDHAAGRLPVLAREAGFEDVRRAPLRPPANRPDTLKLLAARRSRLRI